MNTSALSYDEIKSLQLELSATVNRNITRFFAAINQNKPEDIDAIFAWGLPIQEARFTSMWHDLNLKAPISLEMLECLRKNLWNIHDLHQGFVSKVFYYLQDIFLDSEKKSKYFTQPEFTDLLQWAQNHYENTFNIRLKEYVHNNWGSFPFEPKKHHQLEEYIFATMNRPHKVLLKVSRFGSLRELEYFSSERYMRHLTEPEMKEKFYTECIGKAIQSANADAIEFWIVQGARLPLERKFYTHMVTQSFKEPGFKKSIDLLINHGAIENDNLLRAMLNSNHMDFVQHILSYYTTQESLEQLPNLFKQSNYQGDKTELLQKHYQYHSLLLKTEEKPEKKRFKI